MNSKILQILALQNPEQLVLLKTIDKLIAQKDAQVKILSASVDALRNEVFTRREIMDGEDGKKGKDGVDGVTPVLPDIQAMVDKSISKIKVPVVEKEIETIREIETVHEVVKEIAPDVQAIAKTVEESIELGVVDIVGLEDELDEIRDEIRDRTKGGGGATYGGVADMIMNELAMKVPLSVLSIVDDEVTLPTVTSGLVYEVRDELGLYNQGNQLLVTPQLGQTINGLLTVSLDVPRGYAEFHPNTQVANDWFIKD